MAAVKTSPDPTSPEENGKKKKYQVRAGMSLHHETSYVNNKGETVKRVDIYDGDDPDNNEIDLLPHEALKYAHQIEPLEPAPEAAPAKKT